MTDIYTQYFSGAQCAILIQGVPLNETIEIEASYNCQQIPIYNYMSAHYTTAAYSKVMVAGSIMINYVYEGYLYAHIKKQIDKIKAIEDAVNVKYNKIEDGINDIIELSKIGMSEGVEYSVDNNEFYKTYNLLPNYDSAAIKNLQETFWDSNKKRSFLNAPPRPEFLGPFNIEIRDYKVGGARGSEYQTKTIFNCFINRMSTVRKIDGSPVVESYQFIGQSML